MTEPHIRLLADSVVLIEYEPVLDEGVNARALAVADVIRQRAIAGVLDVVPAYASVAVHVDPRRMPLERVLSDLRESVGDAAPMPAPVLPAVIDVPVTYGGDSGPDLASVVAWSGLTEADVIERHAERVYRVFMVGFLPGFPYMGVVDDAIAMPRHRTPRMRVPAGSVGIAGRQTGIYPSESPGGWQVIGRTTCTLFDVSRTPPALLAPGQRVRFVPTTSSLAASPIGERP